jgi:hypothetical protein
MPDDRDIIDERDEDGVDDAALLRRLNRCLRISDKLVKRLTSIEAGWAAPGPPDAPAVLTSISTQLNTALAIVNRLNTR